MTEEQTNSKKTIVTHVAPGPHLSDTALTTRRMMIDVLIALLPVICWSIYVFKWNAVKQLAICVLSCLVAEAVLTRLRGRRLSLFDFSAAVTGIILALSLPGTTPLHVAVIGSVVAIGLGKFIFGGLGQNIFNPAMVGRAFVMIAFTSALGATAYVAANAPQTNAISQPTPLTAFDQTDPAERKVASIWELAKGNTNGSLGETSAIACIIGGLYLCVRRTAVWQIPVGMIGAIAIIAGIINLFDPSAEWTFMHHLLGGAVLFGAFFIATDPVSSPLTSKGRWIFGIGIGALVMLLRSLSSYPEGVMVAVLLMNALVPLINRWTIPRPIGGPVPERK